MIKYIFFLIFILANPVFSQENTLSTDESEQNLKKLKLYFLHYDITRSPEDIKSFDQLRLEIAEYLFPIENLLIEKEKKLIKPQRFKSLPLLLTEEEFASFSDELFKKAIQREKPKQVKSEEKQQKAIQLGFEEWETKILLTGGVSFRAGYGFIWKDPAYTSSFPGINFGLNLDQKMRVNVLGKVGERVSINIDHNSESPDNTYEIAFKALEKDRGILRELRVGNVELNIPQSSYFIKYQGTSKDNYGVKSVLKYEDLENQTVINLIKSKKGYKRFVGNKKLVTTEIMDISYVKRKYFVLPDTQIDSQSLLLYISTSEPALAEKVIDGKYFKKLKEGTEYYLNASTGELYLAQTLSRNSDLVVRYTHHGGNFISTNSTDIIGYDEALNSYLYLWKTDKPFSRFVHYGYYSLPYKNFVPSYGFNITVVYTYNKTLKADFQFNQGDFILYPSDGLLVFRNKTPFPDTAGKIYSNFSDPSTSDSIYTMQISFFIEVTTYQLDFNVIPGTERVYINGRLLSNSEYRLIPSLGEIYFNNPSIINENDVIEIYYEYKPFFAGSQKLSIGNRLDYKPNKIINLGSTMVYSIMQRDIGAPQIEMTPDSLFMGDIDGVLNLSRLFGISEDFNLQLKGEYAISYYDPNTYDYAIIDDFENIGETFNFSKNESEWILCSPATNIEGIRYDNRGKLLYKDYRTDNWDGSVTPLNYYVELPPEKILDYSFKPGPYVALGGHLNPALYPNLSQTSLIFDFDFRSGGEWVGAVQSVADGPAGINLQDYNEITLWAKLQSDFDGNNIYEDNGNAEVELYIALGQFNEDSDADGVFDYEKSSTDPGYDFNSFLNKSIVETRVGRDRKGGGDGKIQSEDLNKNGVLDTNENLIVIPGKFVTTDISNLTISQGEWKKFTINIKALTPEQINILNRVTSLGIFIKKKNGDKGRVLIDKLEFKKVSWREKRIDGIRYDESQRFLATMVSALTDPLYSSKRFYLHNPQNENEKERLETFEKLHGYKSDVEAMQYDEKSLYIRYELTNTLLSDTNLNKDNGTSGIIYKRTTKAYNLSLYSTLNFYFYILERDENNILIKDSNDTYEGENLLLIAGNSENSYYRWKIPLKNVEREKWQKVIIDTKTLKLRIKDTSIEVSPEFYGEPNTRNIYYIAIGVENTNYNEPVNRGAIWINEMYAYLDRGYFGSAYYTEGVMEYKKPLFTLFDYEILGPFSVKSSYENRNLNFVSSMENISPETFYKNFLTTFNSSMFKNLTFDITYQKELQGSETNTTLLPLYMQWDLNKESYKNNFTYTGRDFIPTLTHSFTENFEKKISRNLISIETQDFTLVNEEAKYNSSSKISYTQSIPVSSFFKINPYFSWEDTFYLYDFSNITNEIYITNSSTYGMKSFGKILSSSLGFQIFSFNLTGSYEKKVEKYLKVLDLSGYRIEYQKLRESSLYERYSQRFSSMLTGFYFSNAPFDKLDSEKYEAKFSGTPAIFELKTDFYINDKLLREANAFIYDNAGNLITRYEKYNFLNDNRLSLYPKFIIDRVTFNLQRNLDFGYQSPVNIIYLSNVFNSFSQIYYYQPFHYNPYLNLDEGRKNSLLLVSNYNISNMQSSIKFYDSYSIEFNLTEFKNVLDFVLPGYYLLKSYISTERNFQSYSQSKEGTIQASYIFRISDIIKTKNIRIGDLRLDLSYKNTISYNEKKKKDEYNASIYQNIWFDNSQNLSYNISTGYLTENEVTQFTDFDSEFGLSSGKMSSSPSEKLLLSTSLVYNWEIKNLSEINLGLAKLPLNEQTIANKEGLTVSTEVLQYKGFSFSKYLQKVIEITVYHETQYRFSDYITANLMIHFVYNQYNEVIPLENEILTRPFKPGYGFQIGADIRITF